MKSVAVLTSSSINFKSMRQKSDEILTGVRASALSKTESFGSLSSSSLEADDDAFLSENLLRAVREVYSKVVNNEIQEEPNEEFSPVSIGTLASKRQLMTRARFVELKRRARKAVQEHKVYRFIGPLCVVVATLRRRGWVRIFESHYSNMQNCPMDLLYEDAVRSLPNIKPKENSAAYTKRCENYVLSLLVVHEPVNLVWLSLRWRQVQLFDALNNPDIIFNKIGDPHFAPKNNLAQAIRLGHWFHQAEISEVRLPRTYLLAEPEEMKMFINDYRNTACVGFLKFVVDKVQKSGTESLFREKTWHIPFTTFEFAINRCCEFVQSLQDNHSLVETARIIHYDWESFIQYHLLLTSNHGKIIQAPPGRDVVYFTETAKGLLQCIKQLWPQFGIDGCRNVWILKPKYLLAGRGIVVTNDMKTIKQAAEKDFLVQKYVERPLLIFNTKGDFRQFFLVTRMVPLQIWMYTENYVRLSTQVYTLDDFHPAVHVTNSTVQKKFAVSGDRSSHLPLYNMWSWKSFQHYLRRIGKPNEWARKIYPLMKQAIIGSLLANQEHFIQRPNTFELFGADFILDEDCTPWLMEINQNPLLALSNPVTARLCPLLAEDIFKVVLDRKQNARSNTGRFELIYDQPLSKIPINRKFLSVEGMHFSRDDIRRQMYNHLVEVSKRGLKSKS